MAERERCHAERSEASPQFITGGLAKKTEILRCAQSL